MKMDNIYRATFLKVAKISTMDGSIVQIGQTDSPEKHRIEVDGSAAYLNWSDYEALRDALYHVGPPEAEEEQEPEPKDDEVPF
jgi:hypothetical protein